MLVGLQLAAPDSDHPPAGPPDLWGETEAQGGGRVLIIRPRLARPAGRTTLWNAI